MKLSNLFDITTDQSTTGTYAGVRFSADTTSRLLAFAKEHGIPKPVPRTQMHATVLYSRRELPNYEPLGKITPPWKAQPVHFEKFKDAIVLVLSCSKLYQRHHYLISLHGALYDFDQYIPHVSLTYDGGEFDISTLPPFEGTLEITQEYKETLSV